MPDVNMAAGSSPRRHIHKTQVQNRLQRTLIIEKGLAGYLVDYDWSTSRFHRFSCGYVDFPFGKGESTGSLGCV